MRRDRSSGLDEFLVEHEANEMDADSSGGHDPNWTEGNRLKGTYELGTVFQTFVFLQPEENEEKRRWRVAGFRVTRGKVKQGILVTIF